MEPIVDLLTESFGNLDKTLRTLHDSTQTNLSDLQERITTPLTPTITNRTLGTALPIFNGGNDDPLVFLQKFSAYSSFHNWEDDKSMQAFSLCLQGEPSWWYYSLDHDSIRSMRDLLQLFRARYLSDSDNFMLRQQLNQRTQLPGETVQSYASDIKRRCVRLELTPTETLHAFIQGLRPDLQEFVVLQKPPNFEEAVSSAQLKSSVPTRQSVPVEDVVKMQKNLIDSLSRTQAQVASCSAILGNPILLQLLLIITSAREYQPA